MLSEVALETQLKSWYIRLEMNYLVKFHPLLDTPETICWLKYLYMYLTNIPLHEK